MKYLYIALLSLIAVACARTGTQASGADLAADSVTYVMVHDSATTRLYAFVAEGDSVSLQAMAHQLNVQQAHHRRADIGLTHIVWLCLGTVVFLLLEIALIYYKLRVKSAEKSLADEEIQKYILEVQNLRVQAGQLDSEREQLENALSHQAESLSAARAVVLQRLAMLNKFFAAEISDKGNFGIEATHALKDLVADRENFMDSTRLSYRASHPKFIQYLEDRGLTVWEINYCCLYLIGLRGKEIGSYLGMRSHYNISSEIRRKLGLDESNANLGIYLRKLLV